MPNNDFILWCEQRKIKDGTIKEIEKIRNSEPSRKVKSGAKNVSGFYPSKKMKLTIQFESHTLELPAIYEKEFDDNVLEYYDQPPNFLIRYKKDKKKITHYYTPDFFVISKNWIGWEEWKTERELFKLMKKNPNRYHLDEHGNWKCPPAEEYAAQYGLSFRVRTDKEINWKLQRNLRFLEDYLKEDNPQTSNNCRNMILEIVKNKPSISLGDLLNKELNFTADNIYKLIILNELYIDLHNHLIVNYDDFPIYDSKNKLESITNLIKSKTSKEKTSSVVSIEHGSSIIWDGSVWEVVNAGEKMFSLLGENEEIVNLPKESIVKLIQTKAIEVTNESKYMEQSQENKWAENIKQASPGELEEANYKFQMLMDYRNGLETGIPERTMRDWDRKYNRAQEMYGNGYVGLIPLTHQKGNRVRKMDQDVIDLLEQYITRYYESKKQMTVRSVYKLFRQECIDSGSMPPSEKTFSIEVGKRPKYKLIESRQGPKAAYKEEPFYFELTQTTPRHGDRPFEIGHMDHTELDIELVCSKTGKKLGKPWLTIFIDAFSRKVLAFYLTYDTPSYRSCMMVSRECVRKFNRLPNIIVVDGGKEFSSVYFDTLLASNNVGKKVRPASKARFGSVCERLFGTTNKMFIHNLTGNTQIMKNVRQVTKQFDPKNNAIWTFESLYSMLDKWFYEVYDNQIHQTLGESPKDAYNNRIKTSGQRKQTYILYDENFRMLTLPTTRKGTAKVMAGRGIKINNFIFWSDALVNPNVEDKQVFVRYDPFNMGVAYAYVENYWVHLNSEYILEMDGRTEKEVKMASEVLRRKKKMANQDTSLTSAQIVNFLNSAEAEEQLQFQRLKDLALKRVLYVIEGGKHDDRYSIENLRGKQKQSNINHMDDDKTLPLKNNKPKSGVKDEPNLFVVYEEF